MKMKFKVQMAEREQEREEYESKINELKHMLSRKSTQYVESNDSAVQKVSITIQHILSLIKKNRLSLIVIFYYYSLTCQLFKNFNYNLIVVLN